MCESAETKSHFCQNIAVLLPFTTPPLHLTIILCHKEKEGCYGTLLFWLNELLFWPSGLETHPCCWSNPDIEKKQHLSSLILFYFTASSRDKSHLSNDSIRQGKECTSATSSFSYQAIPVKVTWKPTNIVHLACPLQQNLHSWREGKK